MSKVLVVTGCAGFIGLNFLKHVMKSNVKEHYDQIVSIDKMGYASTYNVDYYSDICKDRHITRIDANINDLPSIDFSMNTTVDIVNFASESHVDNSIAAPEKIFLENSQITVNLLKIFPKEMIRKFIHISTDEVYGELEYGCEYSDWFKPGDPISPNNPYSASKVAQDAYLMSMRHTFGLNVQFVRMANQFGPHQHPEKMFPSSILKVIKKEPITIYGSGENIRQWTPVVHTVKVIYDLLFNNGNEDVLIAKHYKPLFNNNEIVNIWLGIFERQYNMRTEITYIGDRKGHDTMYALQTTDRVRSYFNNTLGDEFEATIKHYVDNQDIYLKKTLVEEVKEVLDKVPEEIKEVLDDVKKVTEEVKEVKKVTDEVKKVVEEVKKVEAIKKPPAPKPKPKQKPKINQNPVIDISMVDR